MDRNKDCLLLPNQDDLRLGSGHSSIEQIPPQHDTLQPSPAALLANWKA